MKQRVFEESNAARWAAFEEQVALLGAAGRMRPGAEQRMAMADFPTRYLELCHDLAVATERRYSPGLIDRLNQMTLDGHRVLYTRDPNFLARIARFVSREFPCRLRADARALAWATALFLVPGVVVWGLVTGSPELVYSVMDAEQVRGFEAMYDPSSEHIGSERESARDLAMFGYYIFNNIGIAFRAFAGGLLFGIGSGVILVLNGVLLGAVSAHVGQLGFEQTFYSFVIGHGAFELTAIVIAGAAGLRLGGSILSPGARTRTASLRHASREAMVLVYGVLGMLVIAAVIEAFWSSKGSVDREIKFAVGGALWAFVLAYFLFAGRGHRVGGADGS